LLDESVEYDGLLLSMAVLRRLLGLQALTTVINVRTGGRVLLESVAMVTRAR
jgi:hypothetical protein